MIKTDYQKTIEVINQMNPTLRLTEMQKDFIKFCIDILENAKGNEINVIPGRCGLAKSTFIRAWIQLLLNDPFHGAIIVTNSIERLSDMQYKEDDNRDNVFDELYRQNRSKITLLTAANKDVEMENQRYKPILLMTTQRYNLLDRKQIEEYLSYTYNGKKCKRTYVIFDEEPSFHSFQQVGDKELNNIDTALRNGITDLCDASEKDWILEQWGLFREYIQEQFRRYEYLRNQNTFIYWNDDDRTDITEDDDRFFKVIEKYKPTIRKSIWQFSEDMENCCTLMRQGAILSLTKIQNRDEYSKQFLVIRNKIKNYLLGEDVKVIVFDATANISAKYDEWSECFDDKLIIHDCEQFNPSLSYMNIKIVNINTSKNAFKSDKASRMKEIINNYLTNENIPTNDTLFVTYKKLFEEQCFASHEYVEYGYLGNLRGFNKYNRLHHYIQVGLNRQPDCNYLALLLHNQPGYIDSALKEETVEKNIEFIETLLSSDMVADIRNADITTDLIQNIFRTCARNIDNTDTVNVYLFFDIKQYAGLIDELNYHFARLGAKIETVELMALAEDKIQSRQFSDGSKSHAQLIVEWIRGLPEGYQFKTSELLKAVGITAKQLERAKKKNQKLKEYMDSMKVGKGIYKKISF